VADALDLLQGIGHPSIQLSETIRPGYTAGPRTKPNSVHFYDLDQIVIQQLLSVSDRTRTLSGDDGI
jgi:hypothetical protein